MSSGRDLSVSREDAFGVPGLRTAPTGVIDWPTYMTFEQWDDLGMVLCEARDWTAWLIGDWLAYGYERWKKEDKYAQARALTNRSYGGLRNLGWVARKVPRHRRREGLAWSHHRLVAKLEEAEQEVWLDRAEGEGWSVDLLESALIDAGVITRLQPDAQAEVVEVVRVLRREIPDLDAERVGRLVRTGVERERRQTEVVEPPDGSEPAQLQVDPPSLREVVVEIIDAPRDEHGRVCIGFNLLERLRVALVKETE